MNKETFLENFIDLFEETDPASISLSTIFEDIDEWDSLIALSVIAMCDEEYNVKVKGDDIKNATTIEDLANFVESRM